MSGLERWKNSRRDGLGLRGRRTVRSVHREMAYVSYSGGIRSKVGGRPAQSPVTANTHFAPTRLNTRRAHSFVRSPFVFLQSKFWGKDSDDSDESSEDYSSSEESSSEESSGYSSDSSTDSSDSSGSDDSGKGASRFLMGSSDSDSEDEVRVVKSAKAKAHEDLDKICDEIRDSMTGNEWAAIQSLWDKLHKQVDKIKKTTGMLGTPRPYIKIITELEDFLAETLAGTSRDAVCGAVCSMQLGRGPRVWDGGRRRGSWPIQPGHQIGSSMIESGGSPVRLGHRGREVKAFDSNDRSYDQMEQSAQVRILSMSLVFFLPFLARRQRGDGAQSTLRRPDCSSAPRRARFSSTRPWCPRPHPFFPTRR